MERTNGGGKCEGRPEGVCGEEGRQVEGLEALGKQTRTGVNNIRPSKGPSHSLPSVALAAVYLLPPDKSPL